MKKIWILIVVVVIAIGLVFVRGKKSENNSTFGGKASTNVLEKVGLFQVFDLEDVENSSFSISNTKESFTPNYTIGKINYSLDNTVKFNDFEGQMYFVRETAKLNIFQTILPMTEYGDPYLRINEFMRDFEMEATSFIRAEMDFDEEMPEVSPEETIWTENKVYTKKYSVKDEMYEQMENEEILVPEEILGTEEEENYRQMAEEERKNRLEELNQTKEYEINFYKNSEGNIVAELVYIMK